MTVKKMKNQHQKIIGEMIKERTVAATPSNNPEIRVKSKLLDLRGYAFRYTLIFRLMVLFFLVPDTVLKKK